MSEIKLHPLSMEKLHVNGNILQTGFWGQIKKADGNNAAGFQFESDYGNGKLLVILHSMGGGFFSAYCPWAPDIVLEESQQGLFLEKLASNLQKYLPSKCMFIRFDLPWRVPYEISDHSDPQTEPDGRPANRLREMRINFNTEEWNLHKAPTDVQPADTVVLDTKTTDDILFASMKQKTRYNIRLARKRNITVDEIGEKGLNEWYELYSDTMNRKGITVHPKQYFENLFSLSKTKKPYGTNIRLFMAYRGKTPVSGIIVGVQNNYAVYLYGGSNTEYRRHMPGYLLQWEAMRRTSISGCTQYDMFGIPPTGDKSHPMHGLYRFKTGFGGRFVHRRGCWDYPFHPDKYRNFQSQEAIHSGYFK